MNDYHPKAAFALFLNQAKHNLDKVLDSIKVNSVSNLQEENLKQLEKYFGFIKTDTFSLIEDKINLF